MSGVMFVSNVRTSLRGTIHAKLVLEAAFIGQAWDIFAGGSVV